MIRGQYFVSENFAAPAPRPDLFEITYVTGGAGIRTVKGKEQKIFAGNYFLSEPELPAELQDVKGLKVLRLFFLSGFIDQVFPSARSFRELSNSFLLRFSHKIAGAFFIENIYTDKDGEIRALAEKICRENADGRNGHLELIRCWMLEILLYVFRYCSGDRNPVEDNFDILTFAMIYDYCQKYYATDIKLGDLCKELHYSLPYLSTRFKEINGCTFTQLIQRFRVEAACRLLLSDNKKVEDIAVAVGYRDVQSFFKVFKKYMGTTPLQYRKQYSYYKDKWEV